MKNFQEFNGMNLAELIADRLAHSETAINYIRYNSGSGSRMSAAFSDNMGSFLIQEFLPYLRENQIVFKVKKSGRRGTYQIATNSIVSITDISMVLSIFDGLNPIPAMVINPQHTAANYSAIELTPQVLDRNCETYIGFSQYFMNDIAINEENRGEWIPHANTSRPILAIDLIAMCEVNDSLIYASSLKNTIETFEKEVNEFKKQLEIKENRLNNLTWVHSFMAENKIEKQTKSIIMANMILESMDKSKDDESIDNLTQISEILEIEV